MKIRSIHSEDSRWEKDNPTLADVDAGVRALNGTTHTLITLDVDGDHHMGIGGGKGGQVVVYMTTDNLNFQNLEDPSQDDRTVMMICGGQESDFSARRCIDVETALRAARAFAATGEAAPGLHWVQG
jgi:hypothetical protein